MTSVRLFILGCLTLVLCGSRSFSTQSKALESAPTVRLVAGSTSALHIPKTATFLGPYWCQPDGAMVTEYLGIPVGTAATAPLGSMIAVIGLDGKVKARISPREQLPAGKIDPAYIGTLFVNSDEIFVLTRKAPPTGHKQKPPDIEKSLFDDTDQRFLIASFAPNGEYKSSVQLDLPFSPMQAAAFDSGNFVIAGVDYGTRKPRIAIVRQDGVVDRMLDLPGDISAAKLGMDESREHGTLAEGVTVSAVMSTLVPNGNSVLLMRRGASGPQYLISDSGAVRKVRLPSLRGFERETVQPVTRGLLVTFTKTVKENVESVSVLLDRESLKPILNYRFQTAPYSAVCSQGTGFVILRKVKDGDFETSLFDKAP
ncbi:MAG TPA: hypothetical protein VFU48_02130, partial [Nitrospira sp.]|nr:hypothetical protein [Nitrospira sp.]